MGQNGCYFQNQHTSLDQNHLKWKPAVEKIIFGWPVSLTVKNINLNGNTTGSLPIVSKISGTHMWVQALRYDLFSSAVFLPYFSMLILSLTLLGLGYKSTSLSPGFCVHRPRQYDTICWELNHISGFFGFFWLIVWADGINKCGWCLAGGRGCWLKGLHQIPSVSWIFHFSLHFHIY